MGRPVILLNDYLVQEAADIRYTDQRLNFSPWTLNVSLALRSLLDGEVTEDEYSKLLRERLKKSGKAWLNEVSLTPRPFELTE